MRLGVVGVNHKSADLHLRELLAKACNKLFSPGECVHGEHSFVLLSTCNRTEVYFSSEDLAATHSYFLKVLRTDVPGEFEHRLYSYFGIDCFAHLCRVTAGMDSAILAETEIQGQVKNAYEAAARQAKLPSDLHFMFQKSLTVGKQVRTTFPFKRSMPSLEDAVLQMGSTVFQDFTDKNALFVGVSEINCKILVALKARGLKNITLCNRTEAKAQELALQEGLQVLPWHGLSEWHRYDLIVFGTKSSEYLITRDDVPSGLQSKKLLLDLSVPRNVEPLGRHPQLILRNIDQINHQVEKIRRMKKIEVKRIERMIIDYSHRHTDAFLRKEMTRTGFLQESKITALGF
jgi:glutamyl-tRNA reductase